MSQAQRGASVGYRTDRSRQRHEAPWEAEREAGALKNAFEAVEQEEEHHLHHQTKGCRVAGAGARIRSRSFRNSVTSGVMSCSRIARPSPVIAESLAKRIRLTLPRRLKRGAEAVFPSVEGHVGDPRGDDAPRAVPRCVGNRRPCSMNPEYSQGVSRPLVSHALW